MTNSVAIVWNNTLRKVLCDNLAFLKNWLTIQLGLKFTLYGSGWFKGFVSAWKFFSTTVVENQNKTFLLCFFFPSNFHWIHNIFTLSTPLSNSRKLQWDSNLTFLVCHLKATLASLRWQDDHKEINSSIKTKVCCFHLKIRITKHWHFYVGNYYIIIQSFSFFVILFANAGKKGWSSDETDLNFYSCIPCFLSEFGVISCELSL